tara:strand:- start:1057 stop:1554 length:498 start_codon:yes stop_codon:yes gene_type:complete
MASTRYNYDDCRTQKKLQESSGPGRYMIDTPGPGVHLPFVCDPQIRLQYWGANLKGVKNGHPIDIDSDLIGLNNKASKYNMTQKYPFNNNINGKLKTYNFRNSNLPITDESRATHPSWMYRDLEQSRRYPLFLNPQENICKRFNNNINTRIIERDKYDECKYRRQ